MNIATRAFTRWSGLLLFMLALVGCGSPVTSGDGGADAGGIGGGSGGGGGTTSVTSTGTIGGQTAGLSSGYARLDPDGALLIVSSLSSFACPSTSSWAPKANEAATDVAITVPDGGSLVGTFPFRATVSPGTALGFVVRAPATCPASFGDGTLITGGSITIQATSGGLRGSLDARISGGEQLNAQFTLPYCDIYGISGTCQP